MATFIYIDTKKIKPLKATSQVTCFQCSKNIPMWSVAIKEDFVTDEVNMCALCLLYKVPWGVDHTKDIQDFVNEVEKVADKIFEKDLLGRLIHVNDADRMIGGIIAGNMIARMRKPV